MDVRYPVDSWELKVWRQSARSGRSSSAETVRVGLTGRPGYRPHVTHVKNLDARVAEIAGSPSGSTVHP